MPASAVGGLPQAGETKFTFSNRHFEYMLTWYGLAAVLLAVVGTAWWRRRS
jgi:surfeit locus 1 family protein